MKKRIADIVVDFLADKGVSDCFMIVGGGAMHLNDAFGHSSRIHCTYNHHEQACAIAAEAYARIENKIAAVCVTTGPGGTNALTGVVGGYLDSIPMFIVSGQVRYDTTARYAAQYTDGFPLRAVGDQEFDITKAAESMCKYAVMLEDPRNIIYELEKAWYIATTGRKGPVWLDIPVNFQGMVIESDELPHFDVEAKKPEELPPTVEDETIEKVLSMIAAASRPVIYAGGGVRLSDSYDLFRDSVSRLGIPVVTYWNSIDLMENDDPLYCGRGGNMGERAGNFAVQNSDLVIALGTRLSIRQVGYDWKTWAREAKVIMVDIDRGEMKKPSIHVDYPIWADLHDFLSALMKSLPEGSCYFKNDSWREQCLKWKQKYPCVLPRQKEQKGLTNVYAFIDALSGYAKPGSLTAVSNGACCVAGHQAWQIRKGTRFIINNAIASMGYGLPAAIGVCVAAGRKETICLEGDGSVMMNLQELQTVVTNRLPVKIFLINNNGYHSIRITQNNLFKEHCKVGIGPESGDLSFPDFSKIATAFGLPYFSCKDNASMHDVFDEVFSCEGPVFCEVFTDTDQVWEPKSSARRLPDGTLVSPPLEDLAPFLSREELRENLYIKPLDTE